MLDIIPGDHLTLLDHCTHVWYKIDQVSSSGHFSSNIRGHTKSSTTTTFDTSTNQPTKQNWETRHMYEEIWNIVTSVIVCFWSCSVTALFNSWIFQLHAMIVISLEGICCCCQSSLVSICVSFTECSWFPDNYLLTLKTVQPVTLRSNFLLFPLFRWNKNENHKTSRCTTCY